MGRHVLTCISLPYKHVTCNLGFGFFALVALLIKNTAQYGQQIEFTTKYHMFSLKDYPSPENITQPLVGMVVIFCKSVNYSSAGVSMCQLGHFISGLPYLVFLKHLDWFLTINLQNADIIANLSNHISNISS